MKILVADETAKIFYVECQSTDTIAHLKAKLDKIAGKLMFDGKLLGDNFSENMMLVDVGVQDGSLILHTSDLSFNMMFVPASCGKRERPRRRPENDYIHYADAFKSGWTEEHAKVLLNLLLQLCQDGTISQGNVTDRAWLQIQNSLKNSMKTCSFEIDFLEERLRDYKQLYAVLAETISSSIFTWDRKRKTITSKSNWREEYPELLLLLGPYIPYFDTLEEVCLLLNTRPSSSKEFENLQPISTMHGNQVRQAIPRHSKLRSLFCMSYRK